MNVKVYGRDPRRYSVAVLACGGDFLVFRECH